MLNFFTSYLALSLSTPMSVHSMRLMYALQLTNNDINFDYNVPLFQGIHDSHQTYI